MAVSISTLHGIWRGMVGRCYNPKIRSYARYGGRGIKVCERWRTSFENFLVDMWPRPSLGHSLDRINNDGDYEPSNCRWATRHEQSRNHSRTILLTFNGETKCISDWARELGLPKTTLLIRYHQGRPLSEVINRKYLYGKYRKGAAPVCSIADGVERVFPSARSAVEAGAAMDTSSIYKCLRGVQKRHSGKEWRYVTEKAA